jgi:transposase
MLDSPHGTMSSSASVTIEPALAKAPEHPKRRKYSITEKRHIVEESFRPGASVARVARAHGVNANQVFSWRRLYQRGRLGGDNVPAQPAELLSVTISDSPVPRLPASTSPLMLTGTIQLQSPKGRLRIEGTVDPICLGLVLDRLLA